MINDETGETIVAASSVEKSFENYGGNIEAAKAVGKAIAEKALAKGVKEVVFDRGGYLYHGRVAALADAAREAGRPLRIGNVFSTDMFYHPDPALFDLLDRHGVLGVEMEAAGLYGVAAELGVEAVAVLTVSDQIRNKQAMTPEQRETGLEAMLRIVLDAVTA